MQEYFKMIEPYKIYGGYIDRDGFIRVDYPNRVQCVRVYYYPHCKKTFRWTRHERLYT